jgi:hypothetical protein
MRDLLTTIAVLVAGFVGIYASLLACYVAISYAMT